MTREQTKQAIEVMQHFANGGEVEHKVIGDDEWRITRNPSWDWSYFEYRIAQPKPVSIPLTEMQKKHLDKHLDIIVVRNKYNSGIYGIHWISRDKIERHKYHYYFLNPSTQCWEEWSEELEEELMK